jgi:hypothetical protein
MQKYDRIAEWQGVAEYGRIAQWQGVAEYGRIADRHDRQNRRISEWQDWQSDNRVVGCGRMVEYPGWQEMTEW